MRNLVLFCLLIFGVTAYGQISEVRRITEKLCSPEFHGRGYVNKGDSIAAAFLADEFKKLGVEPYKKSYFQEFELSVNTFPNEVHLGQGGREFVPGKDYVVNPSSRGGSMPLVPLEIPAEEVLNIPFIKEAIDIAREGLDYNAILFDYTLLSGDTLKNVRGLANEIAEIVPVVEVVNQKFTWSVSQKQSTMAFLQIQDSVLNKNEVIEMEINARFIEHYQSQNVIAYIPAKKKCAKTVLFTAHYDHLGRMGSNTFFPGANDNASGTAMLLTMARYFKESPSDYNIMFIAFAGEEAGLVGSKFYVENPWFPLKKIEFVVNLDIMGSGEEGITVVNATVFEEQFKLLQEINEEKGLLTRVKKRGPTANSDHYWFTENGVPAFFIYTMGPNKHYHDVFDEYSELSFNEYDDITTLLIEFVKRLK